jgi:hypothetical protein
MIRVGKVIIGQYSPYSWHRDQLPSEGEVPQYPISDSYRHNREHLDHPMMNESNSEYNMSQEHVIQIHITSNQHIYGDNNNNDDTKLSIIIFIIISNHHHHRNTKIKDRYI